MARNKNVALSDSQQARAIWAHLALQDFAKPDACNATVTFTKRDGSLGQIAGKVVGFAGKDSTAVVKVETENGFRSANLYNIMGVSN